MLKIALSPKKIFIFLLLVILFLTLGHAAGLYSRYALGHPSVYGLVPMFEFGGEGNFVAAYSASALLFASLLLAAISWAHRANGEKFTAWLMLSLIFLFLSIDEYAALHEHLVDPVREVVATTGYLYYAWVIPYSLALLVFVASYARFLLRLPRETALLFVVSGTVFVSGAVGFELLGGNEHYVNGLGGRLSALVFVEELLEMLGIALFNFALLRYIVRTFGEVVMTLSPDNKARQVSTSAAAFREEPAGS
ncbi:hypothetical protein SAMN04487965_2636 [Microbulbifer donghaiensis]|uniref:Uncharacterized protein n=1 Tax=Microbulbifer donghaiensis TaxID=494016 RepID=A0A1M5EA46_9GAMM|nr:hypothetical protein [Microbulbifer donghaiensis]SHF76143.1 hypothetical protein SAMN04487965_2636 [Microbulbifer donghaiensis]